MSDDSDDEDDNGSGGEGVQPPQAVNENPPDDTSADDPAPIRHAQQSLLLQSVFKRGIPISKLFKWGLGVYIVYKIVNALFEKDDEDLDEDDEE